MKKRWISLLLVVSMLLTLTPAVAPQAHAKRADFMTEAEAWDAGLDVYTAWWNHVKKTTTLDSYYNGSVFSSVYDAVFPTPEVRKKKIQQAFEYYEDHFDFAADTNNLEYKTYMTLLFACFYYQDSDDAREELTEHMNFTAEQLDLINEILSEDFLQDAIDGFFETKFSDVLIENPSEMLLSSRTWFSSLENVHTMLDESIGALGTAWGPAFDILDAANEGAKFVNLNLLTEEFLDILTYMQQNASGYILKDAAGDLLAMARQGSGNNYQEMLIRYAAGEALTDLLLSKGLEICASSMASVAAAAAASGGAAVAFGSALAGGTALGLIMANLAEAIGKGLGEILVGEKANHTADLNMFYLNQIRNELHRYYVICREAFMADPNEQTARDLNSISKLMFNMLLCETDYAGICQDDYCTAGILKAGWAVDLMQDQGYTRFNQIVEAQRKGIKRARNQYTDLALQAYGNFTEAHVYSIVYDTNGGTFQQLELFDLPARQGKIDTLPLTLPTVAPTRSGYQFLGWSTSANATVPAYRPGATYTAEGDATLYAVWEKISTIVYDANGGSGAPAAQKNTAGSTVLSSRSPSRTGFLFLGWSESKNPSADAPLYAPGSAFPTDGDVRLYAVWKPGVFDIVFHANGGFYANGSQSQTLQKTYLQDFTVSPEIPTRDRYTFTGWWSLTANGEGVYQQGNTYSDIGGAGLSTKNLYAQWQQTQAAFVYDYSNCTAEPPVMIPLTDGTATFTLEAPSAAKQAELGKTFVQWKYYFPSGKVIYFQAGETITVAQDMTVYAEWETTAASTLLSVLPDRNSYLPGETAALTVTADRSGFFRVDTGAAADFTVDTVDGRSGTTAVFVECDSESDADNLKCYQNGSGYTLQINIPSNCRDGLYPITITASDGIYDRGMQGSLPGTATSTVSETIYLKIDTTEELPDAYSLQYDLNGGNGTVPKKVSFLAGEKVRLADDDDFQREGYTFEGWSTERDGDSKRYQPDRQYTFSESTVLYAVWESVSEKGELALALATERYSGIYKPGETAHIMVMANYSDHFYFDVRNCRGFTLKSAYGTKLTDSTFCEKSSPSYDSSQIGYENGKNCYIAVYIPSNCPDGSYTFYVTAANGVEDPDTSTSSGDKLKVSITIQVRKSDVADGISLSKIDLALHLGQEKRIKADIAPYFFADHAVTWTSSNKSVATVNSKGDVTACAAGTAVITAKVDGVSSTCRVTVTACDYAEKIVEPEYLASASTCTQQASYYYVCSCGEVSDETYNMGELEAHAFSDWLTIREATQQTVGISQRVCDTCLTVEERTIPVLPHTHAYGDPTFGWADNYREVTVMVTCPLCMDGKLEKTLLLDCEVTWDTEPDAQVTVTATCELDGATFVDERIFWVDGNTLTIPLGHTENIVLLIVGYENGRQIGCQLVKQPSRKTVISCPGSEYRIFILKTGTFEPLLPNLLVQ